MKHKKLILLFLAIISIAWVSSSFIVKATADDKILSYVVDPQKQDIRFYWKDDSGKIFGSIQHLKGYVENKHQQLVFAMNGGMYQADGKPVGLFIQQQKTLKQVNNASATGNFYMKPNGVLYITTTGKPAICRTEDFTNDGKIKYATQSGPMLLINGDFHTAFQKGSANVNIRNGVGILPGNKLLFAMSKEPINFYDFADFFKKQGCQNALYLDGFVSRAYLPEKEWEQTDGSFGVIIGVVKPRQQE
jgi:uncharacterized protein YigE (DUF2233 family)